MKNLIVVLIAVCPSVAFAQKSLLTDTTVLTPVEITATRATEVTPVTKTTLSAEEIARANYGPDLPFILDQTPGVVANSDAGNGIGYTGLRIRGADASRINVTINGIPYNDAESQGSFFVDVPDIAASAGSIQIQRGVGSSTNGSGAFGATVNLTTNELKTKSALNLNSSFGSYQSFKNTLALNSGLINKHFSFDGRMSFVRSDGYIDRAASRLQSGFLSAAYFSKNNSVRFNYITGKEKTYQSWNGVNKATLDTNRTYNSAGTEKPGDPYANETDNYLQSHYQVFFNHKFNPRIRSSVAVFLTRGKGYYEQYKADQSLSGYGLPDFQNGGETISSTDLIRRLWLDNYFYGSVLSAEYKMNNTEITAGGSWTGYDGNHYGRIISAVFQPAIPKDYQWYFLTAYKNDYSVFAKWTEKIAAHWYSYIDLQTRRVDYKINGFRDNPTLTTRNTYNFFNPRAGVTFKKNNITAYLSYGRSAKEPNRDDFESAGYEAPSPEKLNDFETGFEYDNKKKVSVGANIYYMKYRNQLILTGKINDVGAYTRTNTPGSFRLGLETQFKWQASAWLVINGNICVSKNEVKEFTEYIDDYDNGGQKVKNYKNSPIAFSPASTGNLNIQLFPIKHLEVVLAGKFVDRQFLDNTGLKERSLDPYYVQNLKLIYNLELKHVKKMELFLHINNIFSKTYEPNGYTYSYYYGGSLATENYYFPMAPINIMGGVNISL